MRAGRHTLAQKGKIDYKQLRRINPEAARQAVIEYLKTNGRNISEAASTFGINRAVVYDIIRKEQEGDLKDRSRSPKHQPRKTPPMVEDQVIQTKNQTLFGPRDYLAIFSNTKAHSSPLELSVISSEETNRALATLSPLLGPRRRNQSLLTGTLPNPLRSYR